MINKIKSHFKKNRDKFAEFGINSLSGIFSGVTIGIFFNLTIEFEFKRWIDVTSLELVPAIIYVIFILILLAFFYGLGMILTRLINNKKMINFHLNYISGTYCTILSFLFVLYHDISLIEWIIGIAGIVIFLPLAYFSIMRRR